MKIRNEKIRSSIVTHELEHERTRVNTREHERTRVEHERTRVNMSRTRENTSEHE